MTIRPVLALSLAVGTPLAMAHAEDFTGKTAAYIDWAVKNCGAKGSDQEHKLVEAVNASDKGHAAFLAQYTAQYQVKELSEATDDPTKRMAKCDNLKDWYGPKGERQAGLLVWDKPAVASSGATPARAASGGKKSRRGGAQ